MQVVSAKTHWPSPAPILHKAQTKIYSFSQNTLWKQLAGVSNI